MNAFIRHTRFTTLPPAEEIQRGTLTGYRPSWRLFAGVAALTFLATVIWSSQP